MHAVYLTASCSDITGSAVHNEEESALLRNPHATVTSLVLYNPCRGCLLPLYRRSHDFSHTKLPIYDFVLWIFEPAASGFV